MTAKDIFEKAAEENTEFLQQLGRLTLAWSDVELVLFKLLRHYSGVSWPVAQALFSGTRARTAMDSVRAIAENTDMEHARRTDLEEIFSQILAVNTLRDFVVHHVDGSEQEFEDTDPTKRYVSDAIRTRRKSKVKTYLVGSATVAAMTEDCYECCWRMHPHWDSQNAPFTVGSGRGERMEWKFKPPMPTQRPERSW